MVVKLNANNQKIGPDKTFIKAVFFFDFFSPGLFIPPTDDSVLVPRMNKGTAMKMIIKAKVMVDPRQPYHSATMLAVGKETVPAKPAMSVIMVIAFLAPIPRVRVMKAKQGS